MNEDGGQLKGTPVSVGTNATQDVVYECCWDNCDWQFEDMTDCIDHCIAEQNGHVQSSFVNAPSGKHYCLCASSATWTDVVQEQQRGISIDILHDVQKGKIL